MKTLDKMTKAELITLILEERKASYQEWAAANPPVPATFHRGDHLIHTTEGTYWQVLHIKGCEPGYAQLIDETDGQIYTMSTEYLELV